MRQDEGEWGPWIEHNGKGCPPDLIGRVVLIEFRLSHDDRDGGKAGQHHFVEVLVNDAYASLPEWWRDQFGEIAQNSTTGEDYGVADIIRYRIRKPRALGQLREMIETLPAPDPERETA